MKEYESIECEYRLRPPGNKFPIIVSQDGDTAEVTGVITEFVSAFQDVHFIQVRGYDLRVHLTSKQF